MQVPYVIAFTKADRIKPLKVEAQVKAFKEELLKYWNDVPPFFITSANTKMGQEEMLEFFETVNAQYVVPNGKE
jgi:GTP-binding protein